MQVFVQNNPASFSFDPNQNRADSKEGLLDAGGKGSKEGRRSSKEGEDGFPKKRLSRAERRASRKSSKSP